VITVPDDFTLTASANKTTAYTVYEIVVIDDESGSAIARCGGAAPARHTSRTAGAGMPIRSLGSSMQRSDTTPILRMWWRGPFSRWWKSSASSSR
jgi:hypothetical protein